jgi:DNA transposition AAA+ family ATPase
MRPATINDRELLRFIDDEKLSQAAAAKRIGVSRQAVSLRLQQLRGRTTRAIVGKKIKAIVERKINAIDQLININERANTLLDQAADDPELSLKVMAEIRGQLRLQLEIYQAMFDLQAVQEFMDETLAVIGQVAPEVRNEILSGLNKRKSIRSALRFN